MNKEKCELCKVEYPSYANKMYRTEDNKCICIDCYKLVFDELFKGVFTLQEAQETINFINEYEKTLKSFLLLMKKYAIYYNDTPSILLQKLYKEESKICEGVFNCSRQVKVFTRKGRLELLPFINIDVIYPRLSQELLDTIIIDNLGEHDYIHANIFYDRYITM